MADKVPDLNETFVGEPLCYYNIASGYMCPDSVDGFDDIDGFKDGDVTCPYVRIPFDQKLADSHDSVPKKRKCEALAENDVVAVVGEVLDENDDVGFAEWLEHHDVGKSWTSEEAICNRERARVQYESWKDIFVLFCPTAMTLPSYKGG